MARQGEGCLQRPDAFEVAHRHVESRPSGFGNRRAHLGKQLLLEGGALVLDHDEVGDLLASQELRIGVADLNPQLRHFRSVGLAAVEQEASGSRVEQPQRGLRGERVHKRGADQIGGGLG